MTRQWKRPGHRLRGRVVRLKVNDPDPLRLNGKTFKVFDWFNNHVSLDRWQDCVNGCTLCKEYEIRVANDGSLDRESEDVVLGFLQPSTRFILVHDSEMIYPPDVARMKKMKITWVDD